MNIEITENDDNDYVYLGTFDKHTSLTSTRGKLKKNCYIYVYVRACACELKNALLEIFAASRSFDWELTVYSLIAETLTPLRSYLRTHELQPSPQ